MEEEEIDNSTTQKITPLAHKAEMRAVIPTRPSNGAKEAPNNTKEVPPNGAREVSNGAREAPPNSIREAPNGAREAPNRAREASSPNIIREFPSNVIREAPNGTREAPRAREVLSSRAEAPYTYLIPPNDREQVRLIEEQCRGFCLSLFFREHDPVRSLGITSSIPGEGKSFVATMMAYMLANDSTSPVVLVECDWEHAGLDDYFGINVAPGLAEWLRRECTLEDVRHKVTDNLTIIRAGKGKQDAVRLLQHMAKSGLRESLAIGDESLLVDLPPVISCSYSTFAASMPEALALVVRADATPDNLVAAACDTLAHLPVQGLILNQVAYRPEPYAKERKKTW